MLPSAVDPDARSASCFHYTCPLKQQISDLLRTLLSQGSETARGGKIGPENRGRQRRGKDLFEILIPPHL